MYKKHAAIVLLGLAWSTVALAGDARYQLGVDGLACPFCAYGIEKKLNSIEGVEDIDVDIETGQVTVTMKEGSTLSESIAAEKVQEAGFTLRSFSPQTEND